MKQQYLTTLLEAYRRGYEKIYKGKEGTLEMKEYYFKVKDDLPRVQVVLSFLQGIVPAGLCQNLLDVGSGRGVFLFPLLRDFPKMEVNGLISIYRHFGKKGMVSCDEQEMERLKKIANIKD